MKRARIGRNSEWLMGRLRDLHEVDFPPRHPKKEFVAENPEVPILENYTKGAPDSFWDKFPENKNERGGSPFKIDTSALREIVMSSDPSDVTVQLLEEVVKDIENGCDLAISEGHEPTISKNAKACGDRGKHITDMLASGVRSKILLGPLDSKPAAATINSLQPADKHNGTVRLIINQSSPKGRSINDFVDKKRYPCRMGGLKEVLVAVNYVGKGGKFAKCDWKAAYKHLGVKHSQLKYQYFSWLGKYFAELCLIFGCISSVGLYDRFARLIVMVCLKLEEYEHFLAVQHLDDFMMFGSKNDGRVEKLYKRYTGVCERVGIRLQEAADSSLDKAYPPSTSGNLLGVWFCTVKWKWWLCEKKVNRYVHDLMDLLEMTVTTQEYIWKSVGKVLYVSILVPGSQYHVSNMLRANHQSKKAKDRVIVTKALKREVEWWIPMVKLAGEGLDIPYPYVTRCPNGALQADSDAAGGMNVHGLSGVGIVFGKAWCQMAWPMYVNSHERCGCGAKFRHKLTWLEMFGHLLHVAVFYKEVTDKTIRTNIDNAGTVVQCAKGRCMDCLLTDTMLKAIDYVATALNCRHYVVKVARCSTPEARAADALSKSEYKRFTEFLPGMEKHPRRIPVAIRSWVENPRPDTDLGRRIVLELKYWGADVIEMLC